jgi:hypothetical protein
MRARFGVGIVLAMGVSGTIGYFWGRAWPPPGARETELNSPSARPEAWQQPEVRTLPRESHEEPNEVAQREFLRFLQEEPEDAVAELEKRARGLWSAGRESEARGVLQWGKYLGDRALAYEFLSRHAQSALQREGVGAEAGILTAMTLVETLRDLDYPEEEQERLLNTLLERAPSESDRRLLQQRLAPGRN